jgi:hypothetical protein
VLSNVAITPSYRQLTTALECPPNSSSWQQLMSIVRKTHLQQSQLTSDSQLGACAQGHSVGDSVSQPRGQTSRYPTACLLSCFTKIKV